MGRPKTVQSSGAKRAYPVTQRFLIWLSRPLLLAGLMLSIPAFYLLLAGDNELTRTIGHSLYAMVAVLIAVDTWVQWRKNRFQERRSGKLILDVSIVFGCILSSLPSATEWSLVEWLLRLALCAAIMMRIATLVLRHMKPSHLVQVIVLALLLLATAGAGFYWLEPNVHSYANGVWLAFTTIATVGYGDIVPSTPASKIFAVFIVLLGYAMFSIVTANIAALFVEEDEEQLEQELHADIRSLSREVHALRLELRERDALLDRIEKQLAQVTIARVPE
ncbi:potassium channel family protein [Undibacterium crateris]|uniref:potassium channel family protein n=1 Tax=Undibacterium crateris TaxID=2528175 RepID=UPI002E2BDC6F|nr:potassium channel family protein [Undibacterium crateris]